MLTTIRLISNSPMKNGWNCNETPFVALYYYVIGYQQLNKAQQSTPGWATSSGASCFDGAGVRQGRFSLNYCWDWRERWGGRNRLGANRDGILMNAFKYRTSNIIHTRGTWPTELAYVAARVPLRVSKRAWKSNGVLASPYYVLPHAFQRNLRIAIAV